MFPDRKLEVLQLDHPILHGYYNYSNVHYFTIESGVHTQLEGPPQLMGMNIAARTAVILSPYDMTCGWDEQLRPRRPQPPAGGQGDEHHGHDARRRHPHGHQHRVVHQRPAAVSPRPRPSPVKSPATSRRNARPSPSPSSATRATGTPTLIVFSS